MSKQKAQAQAEPRPSVEKMLAAAKRRLLGMVPPEGQAEQQFRASVEKHGLLHALRWGAGSDAVARQKVLYWVPQVNIADMSFEEFRDICRRAVAEMQREQLAWYGNLSTSAWANVVDKAIAEARVSILDEFKMLIEPELQEIEAMLAGPETCSPSLGCGCTVRNAGDVFCGDCRRKIATEND